MTAQETFVTNGAESTLSSSLSAGATTINVGSTSSFPAVPFYVVIDPDVDAKREVILVDSGKTATTFTLTAASKRGLDGTTDVEHSSGAKVVCVPIAALWTDINDRVDGVKATADAAYTPGGTDVAVADGGTGASTAADARANLGLASMALQRSDLVTITGGTIAGITDLAVADGGTGASTAAGALTNLGAVGRTETDATPFGFVLDEDDMASNSATKLPTQQSVKAYADRTRTARATNGSTQTFANATLTAVQFSAASPNFGTMWSSGANTRLTVTTPGVYLITLFLQWTGNTDTNLRLARIRLNGTTVIAEDQRANPPSNWNASATVTAVRSLAASDYLEALARQDSGGSLDLFATAVFSATLLHA